MAKRVQRMRTKGWRLPDGAVCVTRPGKWGNPFRLNTANCDCGSTNGLCWNVAYRCHTPEAAVKYFRADLQELKKAMIRAELRGKDLACWCPLVDKDGNPVPCHADVLLEIANA
jgi:uncharacterized protein DUF4326